VATIAFFQNRLGRTDGVSLEVDKWRRVLESMGHRVLYCSGNDDVPGNIVIPELYAQHPTTWKILRNASVEFSDYQREEELELDIYNHADVIEEKLLQLIEREQIDLLIPNNLCSGGYQPAAAIAFHRVFRKTGLPGIIHSHDFYFEDSDEVNPTCHTAESIYHRYFPTKLPNIQHVFINRIAQKELKQRKNIDGVVVPNVFDFHQPAWVADEYNHDFRQAFGIGPKDLVFLQATRILDRKGIEMAIDTLAEVQKPERLKQLLGSETKAGQRFDQDSRIILLCAGIVETIGISGAYWKNLQDHAKALGVTLIHVGDQVKHSRGTLSDGSKVYSLWDSYVHGDFVTYPSYWEGWGNQFVEAVFAKLPVLVFEYPVWVTDLSLKQFQVLSLGNTLAGERENGLVYVDQQQVEQAAEQIIQVLTNPKLKESMVNHNYQAASESYSMDNLKELIQQLLKNTGI
jgi:glycosyltransferase involved in cell wall biosynthesis